MSIGASFGKPDPKGNQFPGAQKTKSLITRELRSISPNLEPNNELHACSLTQY